MKFKYITKKLAVLGLTGVLSMSSLTGCGGNTKIVFTTGLSGNQLFKTVFPLHFCLFFDCRTLYARPGTNALRPEKYPDGYL